MSSINETGDSLEQSSKEEISDSDESATDTDASEEIVSDSVETLSDSSEEVIKLPKKSHKPVANRIVSSDEEEEEDDDDDEEDIKLPKKSHKPVANCIVSSDEEEEEEDDDDDEEDIKLPKTTRRHHPNRIVSSDEEEEEEEDDDEDERAISPRTRMSITGIRPADMSDDSSSDDIYDDKLEEQEQAGKVEIKRSSLTARRSSNSRSPNNLETADSVQENTLIEDEKNSPFPIRYTKIFGSNINDKLSSTILAPQDDVKEEEETSDTDVKIISVKNATIEIFSSDDDTPHKIIEAKKEPQSEQLLQPKINFAMPKPVVSSASKSKQQNQDSFKYVSAEFHSKEVRKLAELKSDLENSERVLKQCGKSLPDQGQQLKKRIDSLQRDLEIKAKYISTLKIENDAQHKKIMEQAKVPDWSELSAAVNAIQPKYTGKQGLATFNTQRSMTIETLKGLHSSLEGCPAENVLADEPTGLKVSLMPHQRHALAWMAWREQQKPHGGILADDMGLGKTLTTIAMVLAAKQRAQEAGENKENESTEEDEPKSKQGWISKGKQKSYKGGTLVVCPASLIRQWEDEVNNKLKRNLLSVGLHHGPNRETRAKHLINYDFVVTTYQLVSREHKAQSALFDIVWERIILDEAHIVRNHKAASSLAVYELRGKNRWALTGTPIQNKELDMYALLRFLRCKPFDDFATWKLWIETHTGGKERLHTILKTLMLRRTKALLQDAGGLQCLPEKRTELISVNLEPDEMAVYQKVLVISRTLFAQYLMQHAERQTEMGFRGIGNLHANAQSKDPNEHYYKLHQKFAKLHKVKEVKSAEILLLLLRLRQICCHPSLIHAMLEENDTAQLKSDEEGGDESVFNLLEQVNKLTLDDKSTNNKLDDSAEQEQLAKASAKIMYRSNPVFDQDRPSTKMTEVIKTLKTHILPKNEKAIVVSQWTSYLDILKRHIESHGIKTLSLNGQIPVKFRQDIVNEFNKPNDKQILLLSLTAGGVGLNLVGANHLLLMDLHWNPQLEAQAQDRIYRVGQKKNITVYKFMCLNTVEERIKALQDRKLEIACSVLTGVKSTSGSKLTIDDLKGLFDM